MTDLVLGSMQQWGPLKDEDLPRVASLEAALTQAREESRASERNRRRELTQEAERRLEELASPATGGDGAPGSHKVARESSVRSALEERQAQMRDEIARKKADAEADSRLLESQVVLVLPGGSSSSEVARVATLVLYTFEAGRDACRATPLLCRCSLWQASRRRCVLGVVYISGVAPCDMHILCMGGPALSDVSLCHSTVGSNIGRGSSWSERACATWKPLW